jgi:opacity protein-like surface antigen
MERQQTRSGEFVGRGLAAWAMGLALLPVVAAAESPVTTAQEPAKQPKGRGFVWGATVGAGSHSFQSGESLVVAVGPVDGYDVMPYAGQVGTRSAKVVPASAATPGAEFRVPLPASEGTGGFSFHGGYAFNRRVALLMNVGLSAGVTDASVNHVVGGFVARVWPTSRLWLEAGPAYGDMAIATGDDSIIRSGSITGSGYQVRAGVSLVRKTRWTFDLEGGYSSLGYDGFKANTVTFALGASRLPL